MRLGLARTRLLICSVAGVLAYAVVMLVAPWRLGLLVGWIVTAALTVGWILAGVLHLDGPATAALATREDDSRFVTDVTLVAASVLSLVGVGFATFTGGEQKGLVQVALTTCGVLTVVLSWALVHSVYMLRYAGIFYTDGGGVEFNGDAQPDYRDFAYLAFTLGMTYQVSDTDLTTKRMRRSATHHALLSYLFGTVVVATTINVVAGLVR